MINIKLRMLSILVTFIFISLIIFLLKKGKLKENFSLIWIIFSFLTIIITLNFDFIKGVAKITGFDDPNNALFFFSIILIILSILIVSIEISDLHKKVKNLIQEVSILKNQKDKKK